MSYSDIEKHLDRATENMRTLCEEKGYILKKVAVIAELAEPATGNPVINWILPDESVTDFLGLLESAKQEVLIECLTKRKEKADVR